MGRLSALTKVATAWYVSLVFAAAVGIVIGYFVFFHVYPGKPKIGIIDIPFTVIDEDSAFVIISFLDYVRDRDDIKAVVIKLNSPGGAPVASEQLLAETLKLREKKPVVISVGELAATGGYMMAVGANHTYVNPTSIVGSVGVRLSFPGSLIPRPPEEQLVPTGPSKLGESRRWWIGLVEQMKEGFVKTVVTQRGDRLRISGDELAQAGVYPGFEGVRLGLVDAIGGETEAVEKAADLAGISDYELVDVNTEVQRIFFEKLARILEPLSGLSGPGNGGNLTALLFTARATGDVAQDFGGFNGTEMIRRLLLPSADRPARLDFDIPQIDYLYDGYSP